MVHPSTVCEVLSDFPAYAGKPVAIVGRFSLRQQGRSIAEDDCAYLPPKSKPAGPSTIKLQFDRQSAPRLQTGFEVDSVSLRDKAALIREHTKLRAFSFGTPDYDRWAVVYGTVELKFPPSPTAKPEPVLVYAGDGYVIFLK